MKRKEDSLRELWGNIKHTDICIIRYKKEKREKTLENAQRDNELKTLP